MCRKVVSVVMLLLACSASCWGEARYLGYTDQRSATSEQPSQPLSTLWQKADESLRIIEESLIAQGEPVQDLSKGLPELYQKSQELQENVNALSLRFEYLEKHLATFEKNISQEMIMPILTADKLAVLKFIVISGIANILVATITIIVINR